MNKEKERGEERTVEKETERLRERKKEKEIVVVW
jgi:hypothetical protein